MVNKNEKSIRSVASSFLFNEYVVKNVVFELNDNFQQSDSIDLDFKLDTDFYLNEQEDQAMVLLRCVIFDDYEQKNYPFYINIEIVGSFSLNGDFSSEEIVDLCRLNATAVLFPYLRAFVSNLTSLAGVPNLILPTVNISKLLED
ncbi:protein-export chaperone SecB [Sporosarcina koreensis]|uniref:Protein-export chaperone SecB n=1 Tax=Sporosarcina koreensis TaxID=334735 RepID=A0ABW0U211_9BACL